MDEVAWHHTAIEWHLNLGTPEVDYATTLVWLVMSVGYSNLTVYCPVVSNELVVQILQAFFENEPFFSPVRLVRCRTQKITYRPNALILGCVDQLKLPYE